MPVQHNLAIIIPTRNRSEIIRLNLQKTRAQLPDVPIFVFDDASTNADEVRSAVESVPGCVLIRSESNVGPAAARNALIIASEARWCLAIDDDCYPDPSFDPHPWTETEPGQGDPIVIGLTCYRTYDGDISPANVTEPRQYPNFHGGASLLHRERIIEIGNYDPDYVFGAEDTDLARRVWASNYQVWQDPTKIIIHDHVSSGRDLQREAYFYARNRILLGSRTLPIWYGFPIGFLQACRRCLTQPNKLHGLKGIIGGVWVSFINFSNRRPLNLKQYYTLRKMLK